jgi:hypothetical protein
MTSLQRSSVHDEAWLLLPWLANGRLSSEQLVWVEEHVQSCAKCAEDLAVQQRLCEAFTVPDRVTYAPGPSFRKLLDKLDSPSLEESEKTEPRVRARAGTSRLRQAWWRPPGFAWAASFILMVGMTAMIATAYRWSQPAYVTHSDSAVAAVAAAHPSVLHISFDRGVTVGEAGEVLRINGAQMIDGPDAIGVVGITPAKGADSLQDLAARMRSDPRVRWVEPIDSGTDPQQVKNRGH